MRKLFQRMSLRLKEVAHIQLFISNSIYYILLTSLHTCTKKLSDKHKARRTNIRPRQASMPSVDLHVCPARFAHVWQNFGV